MKLTWKLTRLLVYYSIDELRIWVAYHICRFSGNSAQLFSVTDKGAADPEFQEASLAV